MKCGAELRPGAKYCLKCGTPVPEYDNEKNTLQNERNDSPAAAAEKAAAGVSGVKQKRSTKKKTEQNKTTEASLNKKEAPIAEKKKSTGGLTKFICFLLAAALAFTGFVKPGFFLKNRKEPGQTVSNLPSGNNGSSNTSSSSGLHMTDTGKPSPDADKVTLTVSDCLIEEDVEYTVTPSNVREDKNTGVKVYTYDVSSDQIQGTLNGFMEIRVPYDDTFFDPGENPGDCIAVHVIDENGKPQLELFEVDTENKEVIIYAEHLSKREIYHYRNAPLLEKYDLSFGNTFVGNLSFKECAELTMDFINDMDEMSEAEKEAYFNIEAIRIIVTAGMGGKLNIFPKTINNYINDTTSWLTNAATIVALGGEYTQSYMGSGLDSLSKLGLYTSMCKFSYAISDLASPWRVGSPPKEEVLNLYKTALSAGLDRVSQFFSGSWIGANYAMCMSGVFVFTVLIDAMFEEAMYQKMWDMAAVYEYYGDQYTEGNYRPRTNKEWYDLFLDIFERYTNAGKQDFIEDAVNKEIYTYAKKFWELSPEEVGKVTDAAGYKRMPYPTEAEIEKMTDAYIENLTYRLHPIILQCERTMARRAEARALKWLRTAYNNLNYKVPLEVADGNEKKIYGGYWFRFAGLSETADLSIFQGQLNKDGIFDTSFCMNDWMQAGVPVNVNLYATRDDMEKEKNVVATAQMIPAKTAKETTFVKFYEGTDELVWVMDQQVFRSKWDNYDSCPLTQKDVCQNQPGCTYIQMPCFEKKTECEDGLCTVHTDNYGMYNDPNAVTNTEEDSFRIPPRIISDAADPSIYPSVDMLYFKKGTSEETYRIFITGGKENESFGSKLTDVIPLKEQGAYFIFSCKIGQYACRYRCVSVKEAENMKIEHIDALGREFYGIKY